MNYMDIKEQFVTYEIAFKLKELGFNEECFGFYNNADENVWVKHLIPNDIKDIYKGDIDAPLWQQVIDWFREKHDIDVYPEPTYSLTEYSFKIIIIQGKSKRQEYWDGMAKTYKSYQKAREQAILKAIKLINSK